MADYIEVKYPTIGVREKRKLCEIVNSSMLNALTFEDYEKIIMVFMGAIERLEAQENG